jgi:hypothetical protein
MKGAFYERRAIPSQPEVRDLSRILMSDSANS